MSDITRIMAVVNSFDNSHDDVIMIDVSLHVEGDKRMETNVFGFQIICLQKLEKVFGKKFDIHWSI
jgi:hypothetical protein